MAPDSDVTEPSSAQGETPTTASAFTGIDVVILGVTAPRKRTGVAGSAPRAWTAAEDYATLARGRTPIRVGTLLLAECGADAAATRIARLPTSVSAVFATGMRPSESACTQLKAASLKAPVVISESDLVAAVLAAAAVTTLRRHNIAPSQGRIAVTSPEVLPRLGPLLRTAGVPTLTGVNKHESGERSLPEIMAHHDVLIDLAGTAPHTTAPGRTVVPPREAFDHVSLVLPGLLTALCRHHAASLTIDILAACARAVAAVAPPSRILPALTAPLLVPTVARQAARALGMRPPPRES